jgi:hypothetical protein
MYLFTLLLNSIAIPSVFATLETDDKSPVTLLSYKKTRDPFSLTFEEKQVLMAYQEQLYIEDEVNDDNDDVAESDHQMSPSSSPGEQFTPFSQSLSVKNQKSSSSCMAHAITTLLEQYTRKHYPHVAVQGWSAFDLYYCNSKVLRHWHLSALIQWANKRIAADQCPHSQAMNLHVTRQCRNRHDCRLPTAVINKFGSFHPHGSAKKVLQRLKEYGALMGVIEWTDEFAKHIHSLNQPDINPQNFIFETEFVGLKSGPDDEISYHAIVIVGHGYDARKNDKLYFILQNSHGSGTHIRVYADQLRILKTRMVYLKHAEIQCPLSDDKCSVS